jgi:hypothetical protein
MTTATSSDQFTQRLDKAVELATAFNKLYRGVPFSIEYTGTGNVYFSFVNESLSQGTTDIIQTLCDQHGMKYRVVPLDNKLVITISQW